MESVNEPIKPPLTTTTSILPAMMVLVIAIATLVIFLGINFIANPTVKSTPTTVPIVVGNLATDVASTLLKGCQQPGNPPPDIAAALLVPTGTRATTPTQHPNGGAGDYDCLRKLATHATSSEILGYYTAQLRARGWSLFSHGSSNGSPQVLFQKAGSDTFYWIVGITVTARHGAESNWTYRIYQNSSAI
jgi:hypothetical protein